MSEEIWKDIKGYEGLYQISNYGRVRSLEREVKGRFGKMNIKSKLLTPVPDKNGYLIVIFCKDGKQNCKKIHRLVAEAFIPNPKNEQLINHIDEDKTNNNVENLEWCNYKYNANYGSCIERRVNKLKKPVLQYDLNMNFINKYESMTLAEKTLKIKHIYDCCNGKLKTAGGYIWRYADE